MFHGSNLCTGIQAGALWFTALNAQSNEWISQAHFRNSSQACKSFLWMKWWLWQCNYSAVHFKYTDKWQTREASNICPVYLAETWKNSLTWTECQGCKVINLHIMCHIKHTQILNSCSSDGGRSRGKETWLYAVLSVPEGKKNNLTDDSC